MKYIWLMFVGLILLLTILRTTALTNEDFFNIVRPYATDIEEFDLNDDEAEVLDPYDVTILPGGPDDEVDFDYLLTSMGLLNETQVVAAKSGTSLWMPNHIHHFHHHHHHHHIHHHHHHHHYHQRTFHCTCHYNHCKCCLYHTYRVYLRHKRVNFSLNVCLTIVYPRSNTGVEHTRTVSINGYPLYHKDVYPNKVQDSSDSEHYPDSSLVDDEKRTFL